MRVFYLVIVYLFTLTAWAQERPSDSLLVVEAHFALDAYQLEREEKARIDSLFTQVPFSVVNRIEIYGHTDSLASNEYNLQLSKKRVQSILQYLVYIGLDPLKVSTDHFGEERPKYNNSPALRFKNRRVELAIYIDASLLPVPDRKLIDNPFEKGDKVRLPNLIFVGNQPVPMWESFSVLQELLAVMKTYPDLEIELQGHVCCSDDYRLSLERAKMVYFYLIDNGIEAKRLSYKAFSNEQPLYREVDERTRARNRRVEVLVKSNTGRKVELEDNSSQVKVKAPLLNIAFPVGSARLAPSGDFMIGLVADMLKNSEGLEYEFVIYDNINNDRLTKQRAGILKRTLRKKGVPYKIYTVNQSRAPEWMTTSTNDNTIILNITGVR